MKSKPKFSKNQTTLKETTFQSKPSRSYDENNPFFIAGSVNANTCGSLKKNQRKKQYFLKKILIFTAKFFKKFTNELVA